MRILKFIRDATPYVFLLTFFVAMVWSCTIEQGSIHRHFQGEHATLCMEGVMYYSTTHILTPAYNRDGSLKLCDLP